jgi:hypothetical protein
VRSKDLPYCATTREAFAFGWIFRLTEKSMERVIGFEPTTSCLASTRSTN